MKIAVFWDMMLHRLEKSTDVQRILLPSLSILILEVVGSAETSVHF
jgi:cytochrome c oxidase subunit IV